MKEIKIISFDIDDYKKIISTIKLNKSDKNQTKIKIFVLIMIVVFLLFFGLIMYLILKSFIPLFAIIGIMLFGCIMNIAGSYLCIINDIDTGNWGVSFIPLIVIVFSYKFLKGVSFDKTFIIIGSIVVTWLITKWFLNMIKKK